jgi:hypothetical protein
VTLVLGACTTDAVVLGADSKIQVHTIDKATGSVSSIGSDVDRKLFKFARAGIATYGTGPPSVHVPTVVAAARLEPQSNIGEVMQWLLDRFKDAPDMGALMGGLDDRGAPVLFDVPNLSSAARQPIAAGLLVLRGVKTLEQQALGTPESVIAQMLPLLHTNSGPHVGPPFEFLVIPRAV